jgi:lactose/L-arabinose transport system substrate-binding protein
MRQGWSRGALGLVLALVLAGCVGGGEPEQVSTPRPGAETTGQLTVWGWDASIKSLKVVDAGFREAYPNITVKYVAKPPADTYRNIQLALSAGSGAPDVSVIEDSHLAQFVKLGGLADVTDLVKPFTGQVNAYRWKPATKDGRIYAMPWDSGPVAVFYRRDVFSKAGIDPESIRTWDDYYRAATVIKQKTGIPMWPQPKARNDARLLEMLLWQQGLGYVDAQGNVILDKDPRVQRTLEFMGRFWREDLSLDTEWWQDPWYKALGGGKVATIPEAVWMGTFFRDFIDPKGTGHWGVFKLPMWEPGGSQASNDGGSTLAIFEQSKQKDAAWAYVEYHLARAESQLQMYEKTDIFPALETTYQDPFFQQPSEYFGGQKVRELFVDVVRKIPEAGVYTSEYQEMNALLASQVQSFALGKQTAQQALAKAAAAIRSRTSRA